MDLKALPLSQGIIVAIYLSTFVAARQLSPEPSASSPSASSSSSSSCSRALATTLWGAALAFYSLMADAWPARKTVASLIGNASLFPRLMYSLLFSLAPLFRIGLILEQMFITLRLRQMLISSRKPELGPDTISMSNKLRRAIDDILHILFGINQPRAFLKSTKVVANTYIVLGMSGSTMLPSTHIDTVHSPIKEDDMADALEFGNKTAENGCLMEINTAGKLALMQISFLPIQLRFFDDSIIISVQAIGYVTSIAYRTTHHLPVSPIEAIGFAFSLLVIVHSAVRTMGVISKIPVLIYLNPTQQQELVDKCGTIRWSKVDDDTCGNAAIVAAAVVMSVMVAFTILVEWHVLRISWLDAIGPILFLLSLITQLFSNIIVRKYFAKSRWRILLPLGCAMISFGGIVASIVATILNWQANKFDSRTPSVIHNLPFLG